MLADRGDMAIARVEQYGDFAQELADDSVEMERGKGPNREVDGVRALVAIEAPGRVTAPWRGPRKTEAKRLQKSQPSLAYD
jgi:hypothetical protein